MFTILVSTKNMSDESVLHLSKRTELLLDVISKSMGEN